MVLWDACAEAAVDEGTPLLGAGAKPTAFSGSRPELPPVREGYGNPFKPPLQLDVLPTSSSAPPSEDLMSLNSPQESFIVKSRSADSLTAGPPGAAVDRKAEAKASESFTSGWLNRQGALATADEKAAADLELVQRTFQAWRAASAAAHVRRVRGNPGEVPPHESAPLLFLYWDLVAKPSDPCMALRHPACPPLAPGQVSTST